MVAGTEEYKGVQMDESLVLQQDEEAGSEVAGMKEHQGVLGVQMDESASSWAFHPRAENTDESFFHQVEVEEAVVTGLAPKFHQNSPSSNPRLPTRPWHTEHQRPKDTLASSWLPDFTNWLKILKDSYF